MLDIHPTHVDKFLPTADAPDQTTTCQFMSSALRDTRLNKFRILLFGNRNTFTETYQDGFRLLLFILKPPHQSAMSIVRVSVQFIETGNQLCAKRVEMSVPHQFQQIRFFLARNGFITVLKQMAMTTITVD